MKKKTFVIIGLDRFGFNLAVNLQNLGNEVVALDSNEEKVRQIADQITHAAIGDVTDQDVLKNFDVENADTVIVALTGDIQSGVLVTMLLKEMGVKQVVSECTSELHGRILEKVGADRVIYPEKDLSERLAKSLSNSDIMEFIDLSDQFSIAEIRLPKKWAGKNLIELNVRAKYGLTVIAVRSQQGEINLSVDPKIPFEEDCNILVIGENEKIDLVVNP